MFKVTRSSPTIKLIAMSTYQLRKNERRNRRKAIVLTVLIYAGLTAYFLIGDDIVWQDYLPTALQEMVADTPVETVANTDEIRP